jgi:hypothetical protein
MVGTSGLEEDGPVTWETLAFLARKTGGGKTR